MAEVTAKLVKELREMTGAGMMDCKKALVEADGDLDQAVEVLREKGLSKAAKKAGRIAAMGLVRIACSDDAKTAAIVEVNSETDFVAKNDEFIGFVEGLAKLALEAKSNDIEAFKAMPFEGATAAEVLTAKIAKIGENMSIRRIDKASGDVLATYIHGGGNIGVIVAANGADNEANRAALKNVAMQVAAMNPQYVSRDEADKSFNFNYLPNFLSEEAKTRLAGLAIAAKMEIVESKMFKSLVDGRINKQLKEMCLLDQVYVRAEDGKQTVAQYLKSVDPALSIAKVIRFEVGEGIEKKEENFAEEVAAQIKK